MAASKFFVTVCASLSWAWVGPAIGKARAAQVAAMMVRIMGFLLLPKGWSSFFIVSSGVAGLPMTDTERSVSRDEVDVGPRLDNEHRERAENARDRGDSHRHVESCKQLRTALLQDAAEQGDGEKGSGA